MKITILNGDKAESSEDFSDYIQKLEAGLKKKHSVDLFELGRMNLQYCLGCWTCWWKTPGICKIRDDAEIIFRSVINADFVIFASPLIAGFTSSVLKKITDRLIVLLHPYIELRNGECHHLKRYDKYPELGLLLKKEEDTDDEDLKIIGDIYDRLALNFHSRIKYLKCIDHNTIEEIIHETCNI
jgi:hypothetical protein